MTKIDWERILSAVISEDDRVKTLEDDSVGVTEALGCPRAAILSRVYGRRITHVDLPLLTGRLIHDAVTGFLERRGVGYREVVIRVTHVDRYGEFPVTGIADLVIPDEELIVELKTTTSLPREPRWVHLRQLHWYMYAWGFGSPVRGLLVYIKYTPPVRVVTFDVPWSRDVEESYMFVMRRAARIHEAIVELREELRRGTDIATALSRISLPGDNTGCTYCRYVDVCRRVWPHGSPLTRYM